MFLDDIASRLVSAGVGVVNTNIFLSSSAKLPDGAGPYITLIETGGVGVGGFRGEGGRTHNKAGSSTVKPGISVAVRAKTYAAARLKAKAAHTALDGVWNTTINGVKYLSIKARQEPTDAGVNEGYAIVVFNIDCEKEPS